MYNVDWTKFVRERVPSPPRKSKHVAWLIALIQPIISLHSRFLNFRTVVQRDITILPNKRILEWWLNELFDQDDRRIEIKNYDQQDTLFIFLESENMPVFLPTFIGASNYDFEVCIPCELITDRVFIQGFLDKYKLATKRYLITWEGPCPPGIGLEDG